MSGPSYVKASFSVFILIISVVTTLLILLVTIILLVKCYRAQGKNSFNICIQYKTKSFINVSCNIPIFKRKRGNS